MVVDLQHCCQRNLLTFSVKTIHQSLDSHRQIVHRSCTETCFTHHKRRVLSLVSSSLEPTHWPWVSVRSVVLHCVFFATRLKANIFSLSSFGLKLKDELPRTSKKGGEPRERRKDKPEPDRMSNPDMYEEIKKSERGEKWSILLRQSILISQITKSIHFTWACAVNLLREDKCRSRGHLEVFKWKHAYAYKCFQRPRQFKPHANKYRARRAPV